MDAVLSRIKSLKDELIELMEELDEIDHTHFGRYSLLKKNINAKAKELEQLSNLVEMPKMLVNN